MTLSDKRIRDPYLVIDGYKHKDVKAFIKKIKDLVNKYYNRSIYKTLILQAIDKRAGEKLV